MKRLYVPSLRVYLRQYFEPWCELEYLNPTSRSVDTLVKQDRIYHRVGNSQNIIRLLTTKSWSKNKQNILYHPIFQLQK